MHRAARCGAQTWSGRPCQSPAMQTVDAGCTVGASKGNRNAFKRVAIRQRQLRGGGRFSDVTRFARALEASELRLTANLEADGQAAYRQKFSDLAQTILAPKSRWRYSNQL